MYEVRIGCAFLPITITIISYNAGQLRKAHFANFSHKEQRMCLDTFSRLRRSLATSTLYAAVRILAERFLLYRKAISCKVKNSVSPIFSIDDTLFSFSGSAEPVHRINNLTDFRDFLMILFHEFFNFFLLF